MSRGAAAEDDAHQPRQRCDARVAALGDVIVDEDRVQSSELILVKTDKLTRKALTEPLPANDGTKPLSTQTYECTCATNPGVLQVRRLPSGPKDRQAHV